MYADMFRLDQFRFDEGIDSSEIWIPAGEIHDEETLPRDLAIDIAKSRGLHLIAEWPEDGDHVACFYGKLALPLRWERIPEFEDDGPTDVDERLWIEGTCEKGRDFLQVTGGHTYRGRMLAYCPHDPHFPGYHVSLSEITAMSMESEYFVRGYLCGSEPEAPIDSEGDVDPEDEKAWYQAIRRFHRTGSWFARWRTCDICGCVLLPDTAGNRCAEHPE